MGLFDRFRSGKSEAEPKLAVPSWASFFDAEEYREFLEDVRRSLAAPGTTLEFGDGVVMVTRNGSTTRCGLQNLAQRCRATPRPKWPQAMTDHFRTSAPSQASLDEFRERIRDFANVREILKLRIYPHEYVEQGIDVVHWYLAPGLVAVLTYDLPETVATVHVEHPKSWPLDRDGLYQLGLENLAHERLAALEQVKVKGTIEFTVLGGESFFTSSQVLRLDELMTSLPSQGAIVALPHRHALMAFPIRDGSVGVAIPLMAQMAAGMYKKGPGSVTPNVYWWREERLVHIPVSIGPKEIAVIPPLEFADMLGTLGRLPV